MSSLLRDLQRKSDRPNWRTSWKTLRSFVQDWKEQSEGAAKVAREGSDIRKDSEKTVQVLNSVLNEMSMIQKGIK